MLAAACARTISIDLRIEGDKPTTVYRSRFLRLEERSEGYILLIEAPALRGSVVPVRSGMWARVEFTLNGKENYFETIVLNRGRYQLNPDLSIASLELRAPEEVFSGSKRGFYRLIMSEVDPIEARLGILADDEGGSGRVRSRAKAVLTDLGGGGLGFRIAEGKSLFIGPGTHLLVGFKLPPEQKIRLKGRVCFSLRQPELREAFFGVQFVDLESNIGYKQDVDKILHFVAETQRRSLGARRGRNV